MSTSGGPNIIKNGLILYLDAGNKDSYSGTGTVWRDLSRGGNNATLTNGPSYNSDNVGSIVFDGINDSTSTPTISSSVLGFTMSIWINATRWALPTCPCSNTSGVIDWSTGYWNLAAIAAQNTSVYFLIYNTSVSPYGTSVGFTSNPLTNTWYNFVATFGPSTNGVLKSYTNGILQASNNLTTANGEFTITASPSIASYVRHCGFCNLEAKIPQIIFYDRPLTAQEVLQNYNSQKSRFGLP